jgi:hypothetical protein
MLRDPLSPTPINALVRSGRVLTELEQHQLLLQPMKRPSASENA